MKTFILFISLLLSLVFTQKIAWAEDREKQAMDDVSNFKYQTVQTKEGLNFRVPEDMPIEKRGGIQSPIPFDEYMYGKFKQIDRRLDHIEKKLDRIEELLSSDDEVKSDTRSEKPNVLMSK